MITPSTRQPARKIPWMLGLMTLVGIIALAGAFPGSHVRGAASVPSPKVTSIAQITHDGFRKMNLLADDSQLFVTELPGSNRVIARVTLSGANRSLVPTQFSSLQALDLSPDRSQLLISSTPAGSGDNELWTLPVGSGSPARIGDLSGRDAAWSNDGKELVLSKGSTLYVSSSTGAQLRELYAADGPVFAPRFSPDGKRIRFTVSNVEQNTTSLWEISRDGSAAHTLLNHWQNK